MSIYKVTCLAWALQTLKTAPNQNINHTMILAHMKTADLKSAVYKTEDMLKLLLKMLK